MTQSTGRDGTATKTQGWVAMGNLKYPVGMELIFEIRDAGDGGFYDRGVSADDYQVTGIVASGIPDDRGAIRVMPWTPIEHQEFTGVPIWSRFDHQRTFPPRP